MIYIIPYFPLSRRFLLPMGILPCHSKVEKTDNYPYKSYTCNPYQLWDNPFFSFNSLFYFSIVALLTFFGIIHIFLIFLLKMDLHNFSFWRYQSLQIWNRHVGIFFCNLCSLGYFTNLYPQLFTMKTPSWTRST